MGLSIREVLAEQVNYPAANILRQIVSGRVKFGFQRHRPLLCRRVHSRSVAFSEPVTKGGTARVRSSVG